MTSRHFVVHGRVQGVYFRAWTREQAVELGLRGWVRNRSDGTVEVLAIGASPELDMFEQRLHEGPPASRVDRVVREDRSQDEIDANQVAQRFEIRY